MGRKRTGIRKHFYLCLAGLISSSVLLISCAALVEVRERWEAHDYLLRGQRLLVQGDYEGALREYQKVSFLYPHRPPEDEALFYMGLIYAHPENPKKDYGQSLDNFNRLMKDHPGSPLITQTKPWVTVLQETQKLNRDLERSTQLIAHSATALQETQKLNQDLERSIQVIASYETLLKGEKSIIQGDYEGSLSENQKVLSLSPNKPPADRALFNMGIIYAHPGNPKKDYGKSLENFRRLIKDHPKSPLAEQAKAWIDILQENEKLNQVIEKSKRVDIEIEEKRRDKAK